MNGTLDIGGNITDEMMDKLLQGDIQGLQIPEANKSPQEQVASSNVTILPVSISIKKDDMRELETFNSDFNDLQYNLLSQMENAESYTRQIRIFQDKLKQCQNYILKAKKERLRIQKQNIDLVISTTYKSLTKKQKTKSVEEEVLQEIKRSLARHVSIKFIDQKIEMDLPTFDLHYLINE